MNDMNKTIIIKGDECPIKPTDINVDKHFWDAFGNMETEVSANYIVRFCQQMSGDWSPFYKGQIENFYQKFGFKNFEFNRLLSQGYIVLGEDDKYYITKEFVAKCYASSPI